MSLQSFDPPGPTWNDAVDPPVLRGSLCSDCGASQFPAGSRCRACGSHRVTEIDIGSYGQIHTFTRMAGAERPVAVGEVMLMGGVKVFGLIEPQEAVRVGASVTFAPHDGVMRFEVETAGGAS